MKFIKESFKSLPVSFEITYRDSDGDNISISNDEDVQTLYSTSTEKFVKINIVPMEEERPEEEVKEVQKEVQKVEEAPKVVEETKVNVEVPVEVPVVPVVPEPVK